MDRMTKCEAKSFKKITKLSKQTPTELKMMQKLTEQKMTVLPRKHQTEAGSSTTKTQDQTG